MDRTGVRHYHQPMGSPHYTAIGWVGQAIACRFGPCLQQHILELIHPAKMAWLAEQRCASLQAPFILDNITSEEPRDVFPANVCRGQPNDGVHCPDRRVRMQEVLLDGSTQDVAWKQDPCHFRGVGSVVEATFQFLSTESETV